MMNLEELDSITRDWMLKEFQKEENNNPYRSKNMTSLGKSEFPKLMQKAIVGGNEATLSQDLSNFLWQSNRLEGL